MYASLSTSLLAALGAVLGQKWLRDYADNTRGPREYRRTRRQLKVDGLETWHFEAVLRVIPALLQLSLLLFGTGLGAYLWAQQRTVAAVVVGTTSFGAFFYIVASISSHFYVSCPFTTPALAIVYDSLSAIQSFIVICVVRPRQWLDVAILIQLHKWTREGFFGAFSLMMFPINLIYIVPSSLLGILGVGLRLLTPPDHQPVDDVSRSVLWLCQTSLNPDTVLVAAKRIPDVTFPTDGLRLWAAWGKLFRLAQDELKHRSPSPAALIYAKALTSLYFTAYISKIQFWPIVSRVARVLSVDVRCSDDVTSLRFVLTMLQQWFHTASSLQLNNMPEGVDIISKLSPLSLDYIPSDTLEWFLPSLLHGLCGTSPRYKEECHRRRLFLQPLAIYIIRRLLPIDQPRPLPSHKTIIKCLQVMIAILDWQSIDLEEIKMTDNSDTIETIFPRVLDILLRPDTTAAIQADPIHVQHPEVTRFGIFSRISRFTFSRSPRSRTFSANEVSHFRAILEPLARLANETEFKHHFQNKEVETWSTVVSKATVPQNIEDASTPALCLYVCCSIDNLFKSEVIYSETIWGSCQANADASVLLEYLDPAYHQSRHPELNRHAASEPPPRRWLNPGFQNIIASAYALLMLSTDDTILTSGTTTTVVRSIISAMQHEEYPLYRHVGLKVAHVLKEHLVNITDDVRDQLLPALRSATFQNIQSDTITPGDTSPDRLIYPKRDLHYLEVLFALANSEYWLSQLRQDSCDHMQRCISIAKAIHPPPHNEDYRELSLRLVLIFSRIACADNYVWPEWNAWFEARPDNQVLLVEQAWEPQMLGECPDVIPLLIAFTNKMLSSLRGVSEEGLAMLPKDTVIAALDGISKQVQMVVDARMNADEMQNASEVVGTEVVDARMDADQMQNISEVLGTEAVDARMNIDERQNALKVLRTEVDELLRRFGA